MINHLSLYTTKAKQLLKRSIHGLVEYWRKNWWHKVVCVFLALITLTLGTMYGIARWYIWSERDIPLTLGASFVADYAEYLGLDPHQTFIAFLDDLHIRQFRLVSYWSDIEPQKGVYNFSELDWEFQQAEARNAKVSLAIGLRQPRWPECHLPSWAQSESDNTIQSQLQQYLAVIIGRYKHSPALESYQLENEYFLVGFGTCGSHTRDRLIAEANLVRALDPSHTLIINRSDNADGWPIHKPTADEYGISIYRRVWTPVLGRYIEYPFPAWYYAFMAGAEKIWSGKDTIIHELQMEPWPPHREQILTSTLAEQNKSFNADRMQTTLTFGKSTGMRTIDLWGAEYWYYRKVKLHDSSVWDTAKQDYQENRD